MVISKLVKTKSNSKFLIGYLEKYIRALVLIMPKMPTCIQKQMLPANISK